MVGPAIKKPGKVEGTSTWPTEVPCTVSEVVFARLPQRPSGYLYPAWMWPSFTRGLLSQRLEDYVQVLPPLPAGPCPGVIILGKKG